MASLIIPEEHYAGFAMIRDLPHESVDELISILEEQPAKLNRAELRSAVRGSVESASLRDLDIMMDTLISLYVIRDDMDLSTEDFVDEVVEAMDETEAEQLELSDENRQLFRERLPWLLSVDSLDMAARATNLLYEHERNLHGNARVLTDIRPLFAAGQEITENDPRGTIIVHTLKITYHERRRIKEFFVALDTDQTNQLIEALQRANAKAERLQVILENANLSYIDAKGG